MLVDNAIFLLGRTPNVLRTGLELLAQGKPVLSMAGKGLFALSHDAVREVLERPRDFLTSAVYSQRIKIEGGPCLLGDDPSPSYDRERRALWRALANSDTNGSSSNGERGAIDPDVVARKFEDVLAREYAHTARRFASAGTVDIGALIERTLVRSFAHFYGVDPDAAQSYRVAEPVGTDTLAYWLRKAGSLIALPSPAPWGFEDEGTRSGTELSMFLLNQARATDATQPPQWTSLMANLRAGDVLNQPEDIARSVGVLMLAGTTTVKAVTLALHELLTRKLESQAAIAAAKRGDDKHVFAYALEALRFRPVFPFLARYCAHDTVLGQGKPWETRVAADTIVGISPMTAMFDREKVSVPNQFIAGRPADVYLHFGHELTHTCIGKHLAGAALRFMLTQLLAERTMHPGKIRYDGAAIASYVVEQQGYNPGYPVQTVPQGATRPARAPDYTA